MRFPSCTCRRQYPGAATGRRLRSSHPAVSAFPEIAVGSACTSSFSRLARRSLALRPAHARRHLYVTRYTEGFSHFVTSMTAPVASGWSVRRVGLAPTGKRRLSRRTPGAALASRARTRSEHHKPAVGVTRRMRQDRPFALVPLLRSAGFGCGCLFHSPIRTAAADARTRKASPIREN